MRLFYIKKRQLVLDRITHNFTADECSVIENDSGLHFLLKLHTNIPDTVLEHKLLEKRIRLQSLSSFFQERRAPEGTLPSDTHLFLLNYSNIDMDGLDAALKTIRECMR
jgi:GntR family transcriptional regulator/MocR family aminotransferase